MSDNAAVNKIFNEYEELRAKAAADRKRRINDVYESFPHIREIDEEIYRLGVENVEKILKNPEKSDELNYSFKAALKKLQDEKKGIIKDNNIPADYEEYKYSCALCSDTGYTENGEKCACYKQKLANELYSRSNLGKILDKQNFGNFSFDYYSKEKVNGHELSPYSNMVKIYDRCRSFCDDFDNTERGLLFYGSPGLGKTFLSSCIAKELMDKGKVVIYMRAAKLFSLYEDCRFGNKDGLNDIYEADLLIIDDLGTEPQNRNNFSFLFDIICERMTEGKKIIINTNLSLGELEKMYSSRLTSRIYEFFVPLRFYGSDIRIKKLVEE